MRKLIVIGIYPPPFNGQSVAFKLLVDKLAESKKDFVLINIAGSYRTRKHIPHFLRIYDYLYVFLKLIFHCINCRPTVYVQMSQSKNGFRRDIIINKITKLFGGKLIGHLHGGNYDGFYASVDNKMKSIICKEILRYDKIIVLSERLRNMFSFQPAISSRILCISNGIGYASDFIVKKHISRQTKIRILYLSNLIISKGYFVVLESLKLLSDKNISFEAVFCGDFSSEDKSSRESLLVEKRRFFEKIASYSLQSSVRYEGVVTGDRKNEFLNNAHFFILPTRYINEGQPISVIEAMKFGCAVISTNFRAIPEMVVNKTTGFLLNEISAEEICSTIISCLDNSNLYERISQNAQEYYKRNLTADIHISKMINVLDEMD